MREDARTDGPATRPAEPSCHVRSTRIISPDRACTFSARSAAVRPGREKNTAKT